MPIETRLLRTISEVSADQWNQLAETDNPFICHEFLNTLENTHCILPKDGWQSLHLSLWECDRLIAAMPLYVKGHSYGEFVFDWAWADAYERAGGHYYPKLICASPFSPVTGPRLLTGGDLHLKSTLLEAAEQVVEQNGLSSLHLNFAEQPDINQLQQSNWLHRIDWQYHWHNQCYADFDDFLSQLSSKKRKNIRQERRKVHNHGWRFERLNGDQIEDRHWHLMHQFYLNTFAHKGNWANLNQDFFVSLGKSMQDQIILVMAKKEDQYLAGALLMRSSTHLYGRYWGAIEESPGLHFETCYYQGIEYAIEQGLKIYEPGAQGQHKIARGFLPVQTNSYHYLRDPGLRDAVEQHLKYETQQREIQGNMLTEHSPYRKSVP